MFMIDKYNKVIQILKYQSINFSELFTTIVLNNEGALDQGKKLQQAVIRKKPTFLVYQTFIVRISSLTSHGLIIMMMVN